MRTSFFRLLACLLCITAVRAQEPRLEPEMEAGPRKKRPGLLHRAARNTPEEQLAYAERLREDGETRAAMKAYNGLVHSWHGSGQAATAQLAYAELLEEKEKYRRAFDEYQYLIDHYAARCPYQEVVARQFAIANHSMTQRRGKFLFFRGFESPEIALPLFQQVVDNAPRWQRAVEAQFRIGEIHEMQKNREEAIAAYEQVRSRFPGTVLAEEAAYRRSSCLHALAHASPRDETTCRNALSALAGCLRDYPDNARAETARDQLAELKARLAEMYLRQAEFYDRIAKRPSSAVIAYEDYVRRFPMSEQAVAVNRRIDALKQELERGNER